jgi:hypothetical protein
MRVERLRAHGAVVRILSGRDEKNCVLLYCFDTREFFSKAEFFFLSHESARVWASDGSARGCPRNGESAPATLCISLNREFVLLYLIQ